MDDLYRRVEAHTYASLSPDPAAKFGPPGSAAREAATSGNLEMREAHFRHWGPQTPRCVRWAIDGGALWNQYSYAASDAQPAPLG